MDDGGGMGIARRLSNGVRAVVVQDQQAVFGAASVNVATGYMDDPADLPGLAHFLEHAVHLVRRIVVGKEAPFPGERAAPLSHARRR